MKKTFLTVTLTLLAGLFVHSTYACTNFLVTKGASTDGSTMITHNDDSTSADFRLWIIPEKDWPEGATRDIVID